jgi:hypothetical protein
VNLVSSGRLNVGRGDRSFDYSRAACLRYAVTHRPCKHATPVAVGRYIVFARCSARRAMIFRM